MKANARDVFRVASAALFCSLAAYSQTNETPPLEGESVAFGLLPAEMDTEGPRGLKLWINSDEVPLLAPGESLYVTHFEAWGSRDSWKDRRALQQIVDPASPHRFIFFDLLHEWATTTQRPETLPGPPVGKRTQEERRFTGFEGGGITLDEVSGPQDILLAVDPEAPYLVFGRMAHDGVERITILHRNFQPVTKTWRKRGQDLAQTFAFVPAFFIGLGRGALSLRYIPADAQAYVRNTRAGRGGDFERYRSLPFKLFNLAHDAGEGRWESIQTAGAAIQEGVFWEGVYNRNLRLASRGFGDDFFLAAVGATGAVTAPPSMLSQQIARVSVQGTALAFEITEVTTTPDLAMAAVAASVVAGRPVVASGFIRVPERPDIADGQPMQIAAFPATSRAPALPQHDPVQPKGPSEIRVLPDPLAGPQNGALALKAFVRNGGGPEHQFALSFESSAADQFRGWLSALLARKAPKPPSAWIAAKGSKAVEELRPHLDSARLGAVKSYLHELQVVDDVGYSFRIDKVRKFIDEDPLLANSVRTLRNEPPIQPRVPQIRPHPVRQLYHSEYEVVEIKSLEQHVRATGQIVGEVTVRPTIPKGPFPGTEYPAKLFIQLPEGWSSLGQLQRAVSGGSR